MITLVIGETNPESKKSNIYIIFHFYHTVIIQRNLRQWKGGGVLIIKNTANVN